MGLSTGGDTGRGATLLPTRQIRGKGRPVPLPATLDRTMRDDYEFVILGAGCSGLSLCHHLLESGVDAPILIVSTPAGRVPAGGRPWGARS